MSSTEKEKQVKEQTFIDEDGLDFGFNLDLLHEVLDSLAQKLDTSLSSDSQPFPGISQDQERVWDNYIEIDWSFLVESKKLQANFKNPISDTFLASFASIISRQGELCPTICLDCQRATCSHIHHEISNEKCEHTDNVPRLPCLTCVTQRLPTSSTDSLRLIWDDRELACFAQWSANLDLIYGMSN